MPAWLKYCHLLPSVTALTYHDFHYLIAFIVHVYVQCILHTALCARIAQYMLLWLMYCGSVGVGCMDSLCSN